MSSYLNNSSMDFPTCSTKDSLKDSFTDFPYLFFHDLLSSLFSVIASRNRLQKTVHKIFFQDSFEKTVNEIYRVTKR